MSINDKIREVAKETEELVEENKKLEQKINHHRHMIEEYKQIADESLGELIELRKVNDQMREEADSLIAENWNLKEEFNPKSFDFHMVNKLYSLAKTPCVSYSRDTSYSSSIEILELVDGTEITIEKWEDTDNE